RDPQPFRSPLRSVLRRSRLLRPLLTSRSASASPFQAQGESSPGKNSVLRRTTAGFTPPEPRPSELRGSLPARPARRRLGSGSCTSAHGFAPRFLPTVGHPSAVAVRFDRDGLLSAGLPPAGQRPCWAHKDEAPAGVPAGAPSLFVGGCHRPTGEAARVANPRAASPRFTTSRVRLERELADEAVERVAGLVRPLANLTLVVGAQHHTAILLSRSRGVVVEVVRLTREPERVVATVVAATHRAAVADPLPEARRIDLRGVVVEEADPVREQSVGAQ